MNDPMFRDQFLSDALRSIEAVLLDNARGATIRFDGRPPTKGWAVAQAKHERKYSIAQYIGDYDVLVLSLLSYALDAYESSTTADAIGLWLSEGQLYVDRVMIFNTTQEQAVQIGRNHGQLAIYNLESKETITL